MAKGKRTPALFEIINRAQTRGQDPHLQVPGWWRSLSETAETDRNLAPPSAPEAEPAGFESDRANYDRVAEAVERAAAEVAIEDQLVADFGEPAREASAAPTEEDASDKGGGVTDSAVFALLDSIRAAAGNVLRVQAGRVEFSLSLLGIVVGGGLGLIILSASFAWGHALGKAAGIQEARQALQEQAVDSVQAARRMQPDASVLDFSNPGQRAYAARTAPAAGVPKDSPTVTARESGSAKPTGVVRRVGWNYLVIQNFRGSDAREEAARAERFILANLPAVNGQPPVSIEQLPDGSHILLSTIGYPPGDATRREALERVKEQIRQIGKLYRQRGGGYDFRDAYAMRLSHMPTRRR